MPFSSVIHRLRRDADLGIREMCRITEMSSLVGDPISPAYVSRLERGAGHVTSDKITLDKLWGLGFALGVNPLALFVASRSVLSPSLRDREARDKVFPVADVPAVPLHSYLRDLRREKLYSLAEVSLLSATLPHATFGVSAAFLSQVETDFHEMSSKLSGEKLWALGVVFGVDPLALYVLSRKIPGGYHLLRHRDILFRRFSV